MAAESARDVLGDAWGRIPHTRETTEGLGTFTRTRIERIITLVVGFGCLALGAQAFVAALAGGSGETGQWHDALLIVTFAPLAAMILACGAGRFVRPLAGLFSVVYLVVLALWPIATAPASSIAPPPVSADEPWIFYLINLATVAAVLAFPLPLQIAWAVATPLLFGVVRLVQGGFAAHLWIGVVLDVSFTLILGGLLVTLAWLYRAVAANVDETRARAVESYAAAAAAAAAEEERVAVAGLMHDSVLAALIASERAASPREKSLAVSMAREALTRLANTDSTHEEGSDEPVSAEGIAAELERVAREAGVDATVERGDGLSETRVPGRVARALVLAAAQAVANSVQHADAVGLALSVRGHGDAGVGITVRDAGPGFSFDAIPPDRLGIRGSIIARVAAVGGLADIRSGESGTTVALTWEGAA